MTATWAQTRQMEDIIGASVFTDEDRAYWRAMLEAAEPFEVRQMLYNLAAEHRRRTRRAA